MDNFVGVLSAASAVTNATIGTKRIVQQELLKQETRQLELELAMDELESQETPKVYSKKLEDKKYDYDCYTDKYREKICRGDANDWLKGVSKETLRSYKMIPRDTDVAKLSEKEREALADLTYQQLAHAGYRLAYILNDIFKE